MRPRNSRDREVMRLSAALPPISAAQRQYAVDHCFEKVAYIAKMEAWCTHCGGVFSVLGVSLNGGEVTCPHCGARLAAKNSRKQKVSERWYYTVITTAGDWQVCRHFIASKCICKGGHPYITVDEAVQNWIDKNGKEEIVARPCKAVQFVYDAWNFAKPMELRGRRCRSQSIGTPDKYEIHSEYTYPQRGVLKLLRRNGYTSRCEVIPPSELMKLLLRDREAEMLAKTRQFSILRFKWEHGLDVGSLPFSHAVRIANRRGYIVKDASMWYDYLRLLDYFHLDTHSPHYICPADLKAEHDKLSRRKERIEQQREAEEKKRQAAKYEARYRKEKGAYFGICFGNEHIQISVIASVAAMAEEGSAMHHCVYSAEYFLKKDSLILSARRKDNGERIETVEVNLSSFKVVQSRAHHNGVSPEHEEILALVRRNIDTIRQIKNAA